MKHIPIDITLVTQGDLVCPLRVSRTEVAGSLIILSEKKARGDDRLVSFVTALSLTMHDTFCPPRTGKSNMGDAGGTQFLRLVYPLRLRRRYRISLFPRGKNTSAVGPKQGWAGVKWIRLGISTSTKGLMAVSTIFATRQAAFSDESCLSFLPDARLPAFASIISPEGRKKGLEESFSETRAGFRVTSPSHAATSLRVR